MLSNLRPNSRQLLAMGVRDAASTRTLRLSSREITRLLVQPMSLFLPL
jgi:hypothetical protein